LCFVKVETGRALDAVDGFTLDSLHKQGFTAVFLGIGKLTPSFLIIGLMSIFISSYMAAQ